MDLLLDVDLSAGRRAGIERALRAAIRGGRLAAGSALPSTRALAADLGVAQGTVVDAYDQLVAEGYLTARPGGRTAVASLPAAVPSPARDPCCRTRRSTCRRAPRTCPASRRPRGRRRSRPCCGPGRPTPSTTPPRGRPELAGALAGYLARSRGVVAAPDQVVVRSGIDHALDVVARALGATGRTTLALEDPCLPSTRRIVAGAGTAVVPAVDRDGVVVDALATSGAGGRW